jgi:hypothetical protein
MEWWNDEIWNNGIMEYWNDGPKEGAWFFHYSIIPIFQHSRLFPS